MTGTLTSGKGPSDPASALGTRKWLGWASRNQYRAPVPLLVRSSESPNSPESVSLCPPPNKGAHLWMLKRAYLSLRRCLLKLSTPAMFWDCFPGGLL